MRVIQPGGQSETCPPIIAKLIDDDMSSAEWWARRKSAFAHPTGWWISLTAVITGYPAFAGYDGLYW
jgi:hypothetical protein